MATKNTRSGGKFAGSHTTFVDAAIAVADIVAKRPEVTKIVAGYITPGLRPLRGQKRVKITDREGNVFLSVRDNTSHQEVVVYTSNMQATKLAIAQGARNASMRVSFRNGHE